MGWQITCKKTKKILTIDQAIIKHHFFEKVNKTYSNLNSIPVKKDFALKRYQKGNYYEIQLKLG